MSRGTIDFGGCAPGPCLDAAARCARPGVAFVLFAATCAQAATLATIDTGPVAGQPSLEIGADGLPVIAYRTLTNKLRVAKCGNWDCTDVMRIELTGTYTTTAHFSLAITPSGFPRHRVPGFGRAPAGCRALRDYRLHRRRSQLLHDRPGPE